MYNCLLPLHVPLSVASPFIIVYCFPMYYGLLPPHVLLFVASSCKLVCCFSMHNCLLPSPFTIVHCFLMYYCRLPVHVLLSVVSPCTIVWKFITYHILLLYLLQLTNSGYTPINGKVVKISYKCYEGTSQETTMCLAFKMQGHQEGTTISHWIIYVTPEQINRISYIECSVVYLLASSSCKKIVV